MTTYEKAKFILQYRGYAKSTQKSYLSIIEKFLRITDIAPSKLSKKDFDHYLMSKSFTSRSDQNAHISSLKFLYHEVLEKKIKVKIFKRPRKSRPLPRVIDYQKAINSIDKITNIKHRCILAIAISAGLRRSEIKNLMISDIDSGRMIITVRAAKGNKDRNVLLTKKMLNLLRLYYKSYRPTNLLFEGQKGGHYSCTSMHNICKRYLGVSMHVLRHTYASTMLENGNDLRIIQNQLGHNSSKTTEIYTHVSLATIRSIQPHY